VEHYRLLLAECLFYLGEREASRALLGPAAEQPAPGIDVLLASMDFAEGNADEALARLQRAEEAPASAGFHCQVGNIYLARQRCADGERAFRRALEIDPDSEQAYLGLARAMLGQNRPEQAAEHALHAAGLLHFFPAAHFTLGQALVQLGWHDRAIQAFDLV